MRRLPLRGRITLLASAAVAVAVAACAVASWFLVRDALYGQLDRQLHAQAEGPGGREGDWTPREIAIAVQSCTSEPISDTDDSPFGFRPPNGRLQQVVLDNGQVCTMRNGGKMPVSEADLSVVRGEREQVLYNGSGTDADGERVNVRIITSARYLNADGYRITVMTALPLQQVTEPLRELALTLLLVSACGIVGSAIAGLVIARASLKPVDRLTDAVEEVARTEDLSVRIPEEGTDEIARLGRSFNTMTAALAASQERQRNLIADAGHELRTPLTSMRTNIDLLIRSQETGRDLPPETKTRLLDSVRAQMRELTSLIGDLLQLGSPAAKPRQHTEVAFHEVVERAVERARLRGHGLTVTADLKPWWVEGDPDSLERAVVNLCDNAVKFSPPAGTVEVTLNDGVLLVRDHGPGVSEEDLPYVFERFWRSPSARSLPGSGLGLAIVAQVAREAGGDVSLTAAPGGGTVARLSLPGTLIRS
ncbi:HAMP domain-containing sensor histidine kinase [Actinocorallia sp. A-T 12471]|uniref:sensor histidine kinase n=1 Tax=Actinocorallia sp. A-T 12471 TaxID=3089813 RepID=UPI0029D31738|nr:HAMP domain-containing sensor histidine kinase [Actinocorallia sp. A-T 12471]MDX6743007.1 HAMP domain-containing sensor histidine kinase [Actinocorallia sp. A-T 12471]